MASETDLSAAINRPVISRQVASVIRDQVLSRRLAPGARIIQSEWADRLKVSRMPVRDAINALVKEGVLAQSHTGAAVVAEIDPRDVRDGYKLNAIISGLAARRAADYVTNQELASLERINDQIVTATASGDLKHASKLNWDFHRVINRASRSTRLVALLSVLAPSIPHSAFEMLPDWSTSAPHDHAEIIKALREGDGDSAERLMVRHIEAGSTQMLSSLEDQPASKA